MKISREEDILIRGCKKNDLAAQKEIYRRYYKAMYNAAYRITGSPVDAEDIMQEAFLKAFDKIRTLNKETSFGVWLKKIVVNESIKWLRKYGKYFPMEMSENLTENSETDEEQNIQIQNQEQARYIIELIYEMKDRYRIALSLFLIDGYDYQEIGEIMNISYGNARTLISRAKTQLKKQLNKHGKQVF